MTKAAVFRCVVLTLARTAPRHSKGHTTRPGSLWGARVPALQAYRPTRAIRQIVAVEVTTPLQPVRPQAFNIILTSNQIAQIRTRILLMSRAARHFSSAPRHQMRITSLRSAPKKLLQGDVSCWLPFGPFVFFSIRRTNLSAFLHDGVGDAPNWGLGEPLL
jgi:hypothetical protein